MIRNKRRQNWFSQSFRQLRQAVPLLPLMIAQNVGRQKLERTPEPDGVMEDAESVADYDRALETQLSVAYAVAIQLVYQHVEDPARCGRALDLACGTGYFTLALAERLGFETVTGVDLSQPMLAAAQANAEKRELGSVDFCLGNATNLNGFADNSVDLCCFNQAAHHMADLDQVAAVLKEMDRVTRPQGLVLVTDLLRLRTDSITKSYVRQLTADYDARGLSAIRSDFRNSMYAAWTLPELNTTPPTGKRSWTWYRPLGLPSIGFGLGSAGIRNRRRSPDWIAELVPDDYSGDLKMLQRLIRQVG